MSTTCRVCLDPHPTVQLMCKCRGTMGKLHEECFRQWWWFIHTNSPYQFPACDVCLTQVPALEYYKLLLCAIKLGLFYVTAIIGVLLWGGVAHNDIHVIWVWSHVVCMAWFGVARYHVCRRIVLLCDTNE